MQILPTSSSGEPRARSAGEGRRARARWRRALKWLLSCTVTLVVLLALLLGVFGVVVGRVPEYRVQLQDWLSDRTGLVVEFRGLSARLRFFGPELVFEDAVVRTPDRSQVLATARRGTVGFDIWSSLRNGQLSAGRFSLRAPEISLVRTREGRIQLLGQAALPERSDDKPFALEQLPTGQFRVHDALVTFKDELTGRGPWSMSGISFELTHDVGTIRLEGEASLPRALGRSLRFDATAVGGLQDPHAVVSTFSIAGDDLDLAGWADVFPDDWPAPETGRGSLELSGSFRGRQLVQLGARLDFSGVSTALPLWSIPLPGPEPMPSNDRERAESLSHTAAATSPSEYPAKRPAETAEMVSYQRVAFTVHATRSDGVWHLAVADLDITRAGRPWQSRRIEAHWAGAQDGKHLMIQADRIVLDNLWPLLAYLPEGPELARLRALRAHGLVENLKARIAPGSEARPPAYEIDASLKEVGFDPIERIPGLTNLTGTLHADQSGGALHVAARELELELPRLFRDVLVADTVEGTVRWSIRDTEIEVQSEELHLSGDDGRASAALRLQLPRDDGLPVLELSARGEDLKLSSTGKYVPGHRLSKKTLAWFDRAFVDGRIKSATFEMNGPIRLFPFRNGEGTFRARAEVEDAALAYHDAWLPATGIRGEVTFENARMVVRAQEAQVGMISAQDVLAEIKDLKDVELTIAARATGDLRAALSFLRASPLEGVFAEQLKRLEGSGSFDAEVRLVLPIKHMHDRDVRVSVQVANGTLKHADVVAPVRALSGTLAVRNSLVTRADLQGEWLDGPLSVTVQSRDRSSAELVAQGRAEADELIALFRVPSQVALAGAADWKLTTLLSEANASNVGERRFRLWADARDLAIGLPQPLGKQAAEPRQLELDFSFDERDAAVVRGAFGSVRALLSLKRGEDGWQLARGGVRADGQAASVPSHPGLRIEGAIDRFVLDEWLALRGRSTNGRRLSEWLQAANVRVGVFESFGYRWSDVRGVLQATPSGWRIDVDGPDVSGQILLPESFSGTQPLRAALERLVLTKVSEEERPPNGSRHPTDPRTLPPLDIHIADLRADGRALGAVDLVAVRAPAGLRFEQMRVANPSARADGRGEWLMSPQGPRSSLSAVVTSSNVAATLTALDYTPFLEAQHGEIRAQLTWPGGFDDNILEQASGTISVRAENGQIVNLQPGAGRVLGLLSVAALPRRLALDFSDLTDKGLAFDSIHGDFELRDGHAYTSNLLLRGPAAEIGIAGRTGFVSRDYDQTAVVTGNVGASLPVAGALAGGPAVGAALLLFSQMFKEPLKGIARGYYRITGPWDNPHVERVDASAAKDASARSTGEFDE